MGEVEEASFSICFLLETFISASLSLAVRQDSTLPKKMKLARWELGAALEAEKAID